MNDFFNPFFLGWMASAFALMFESLPWWARYPLMCIVFGIGRFVSDRLWILIPT